jgi:predicted anti-sigma-YlaC factor YlaD
MDSDEHRKAQDLLPWYVTGRLDPVEQARLRAHIEACTECQADIRAEERLEAEVARLPLEVERGWAQMRERLAAEATPARRMALPRPAASWLGWGVAAALAVMVGVSWLPQAPASGYHVLGEAPAAAAAGNIVVVFLPDTTERQMREALKASGARLTDGPTAANGYLLRVPAAQRPAALATLRAQRIVAVAEPIDSGAAP